MWFVLAGLLIVWVLLHAKSSRADGELVRPLPSFRRMLINVMPGRNESVVYFERQVRAEKLLAFLEKAKPKLGADMTHAMVGAYSIALQDNPRMNQFTAGGRLYKRNAPYVTFSMKRKAKNRRAKLSAVKLECLPGESFADLCTRINGTVKVERSGERTAADKELDLLSALPQWLLFIAVRFVRWADYHGLLPKWFIDGDGMFTSGFIANLGSVGMAPGFHHLYEYGTCPLFIMLGKVEDRPVIENGQVVPGKVLTMRFSYDERIDDGQNAGYGIEALAEVLENPELWFGCISDDGSDVRPMWPHGRQYTYAAVTENNEVVHVEG